VEEDVVAGGRAAAGDHLELVRPDDVGCEICTERAGLAHARCPAGGAPRRHPGVEAAAARGVDDPPAHALAVGAARMLSNQAIELDRRPGNDAAIPAGPAQGAAVSDGEMQRLSAYPASEALSRLHLEHVLPVPQPVAVGSEQDAALLRANEKVTADRNPVESGSHVAVLGPGTYNDSDRVARDLLPRLRGDHHPRRLGRCRGPWSEEQHSGCEPECARDRNSLTRQGSPPP
jgi:hypothetical protein